MAALVVGLGNPGPEYADTRHNIGQTIVTEAASRYGTTLSRHKSGAFVGTARLPGAKPDLGPIVLAVPFSFMNLSGGPVAALARYHKVAPEEIVVVHDDLDLPLGTIRLKRGGGEGGHNGLRSVTRSLGTADYVRIRFGIGRPGRMDAADYVLRPFAAADRKAVPGLVDEAVEAIEAVLTDGLEAAQQRFHTAG
ncbi:MAG: aminoacyl-tRNA hydrolase [Demequinaceae bacterium]|nr:aminoacyl-tRNA hydrolase [Demequinaceae bacterium]